MGSLGKNLIVTDSHIFVKRSLNDAMHKQQRKTVSYNDLLNSIYLTIKTCTSRWVFNCPKHQGFWNWFFVCVWDIRVIIYVQSFVAGFNVNRCITLNKFVFHFWPSSPKVKDIVIIDSWVNLRMDAFWSLKSSPVKN